MNTSEVLNRAADLIEQRGWAQGAGWQATTPTTPLCAEGAIRAVAVDHEAEQVAVARVSEHLGLPATFPYRHSDLMTWDCRYLWVWNDVAPVEATEVIAVLRAAALVEAAKENAETPESVEASR